jgi:hypothetical protein
MDFLRHLLLVIHLLGYGALLGGLLVQARESSKKVHPLMRDGIGTAVVAGLILFGLDSGEDYADTSWHWKMTVKLVVGLVVLVLVMANMRKERISDALWALILALTVGNVCVAIFWH